MLSLRAAPIGDPFRRSGLSERLLTPAADEVYDLHLVPVGEFSLIPFTSGQNHAVVFDRDPVAFEFEGVDEVMKESARCELRKLARLAIDEQLHRTSVAAGRGRCYIRGSTWTGLSA